MKRNFLLTAGASLLLLAFVQSQACAYTHPCIPNTRAELDTIKANLDKQPWKNGYALLAADGKSQLGYVMQGPFAEVGRTPDVNLWPWRNDMQAAWNLARMWYFTGNAAYAQKARDILIAWANTHTSFTGQEISLSLGDYAHVYGGAASILRGTWPGWTAADTTTMKNYFLNVYWPACLGGVNYVGPANKGSLNMKAGIAIAAFLDDTAKFNFVIDHFRSHPASGLTNTLPTGEMGETGRDAGHSQGDLYGKAFVAEVAWKQGIDLFSELDNRLLAVGEYYARNTLTTDNPFVPFGTIDYTYYGNAEGPYVASRAMLYIIQNAYKNRKNLPTPWIDRKIEEQPVDIENWMYAKTADSTTATPPSAVVRPAVSLASSGLTLTTLGTQTTGRSLSYANNVWTMTGLGNNVWVGVGGADDCQFAYRAMTGDCAIVARVNSFTFSGNNNGKCGLMIRDNLSATVSQRSWIGIIPASPNIMESRSDGWTENWGGSNWSRRSQALPPGMPYWIKLERRGNIINSYTSQDGTSWAAQLCSYYGNLPSTVYIGLFLCSGTATAQTATFANVSFTGGTGGIVTAPAAPAAVIATASSNSVTVRWLPSFGATSYMLLRSTNPTSGFATVASNLSATTTSYVDTSAAAGTAYYYAVRAINSAGTATSAAFGASHTLIKPLNYIAVGGTAIDSAGNSSNAGNAFDRDPYSQWFYTGTTGWLQYDLGANNAKVVNRYSVTEAITIAERDPKDWQFQGSQDGTNWTTLDSQTNQSFAYLYQRKDYDISNTTAYRYYRLNVTANNGDPTFLHVGEFGLWSATGSGFPAPGTYKLQCRTNGIMLDSYGRTAAGDSCAIYLTDSGHVNQTWTVSYVGSNVINLRAVGGGLYLDGGGLTANGAACKLWTSSTSNNLRWTLIDVGGGYFKLKNVATGMCVDIGASPWANGDNCEQWGEGGSTNQQWRFVAP
jgi:hypothetical protein